MVTALLLQKEFYPMLVLDVTESLPESTVVPDKNILLSANPPWIFRHTDPH